MGLTTRLVTSNVRAIPVYYIFDDRDKMITIQQHKQQEQTWDDELRQSHSRIHFFISGQGTGKTTYLLRKHKESPSSIILAKSYTKINDLQKHAEKMMLQCDLGIGLLIPSIEKYCSEIIMGTTAGQQIMDGIKSGFKPRMVHDQYCNESLCPYRSYQTLYRSGMYDHYVTSLDMAASRPLFDTVETVCIDETSDLFREEWGEWIPQTAYDEIKTTFKTTLNGIKWMELNQSRKRKYKRRLTNLYKKWVSNPNDQTVKDKARETSIILRYLETEVILDVETGNNNDVRLKLPSKMYRLLRHNPGDPPLFLIASAIDATKTSFISEHLAKCTQILVSLTAQKNLNFIPEFHRVTQFNPNSTEVLCFNVKSSISNNKAKEIAQDWCDFLREMPRITQEIKTIHNICRMQNNNIANHKLLLITFKIIADKLRIIQKGTDAVIQDMGENEYFNHTVEVSTAVQTMQSYPFNDAYIQHFGHSIKGYDKSDIGSVVIYGDYINNDYFQTIVKKYNTKPITTEKGFHSLMDTIADHDLMNEISIEIKDLIGRSRGRCTVGYYGFWGDRIQFNNTAI